MNAKFFDVKKAKQDSIINAALKIFSQNGYKKASTDVIVKEAGISKGLLFHYFISKKGLYEFICDYSVKYMTLELTRAVKRSEKDFFKVQVQIERARTRVMKNYPYMQQFINNMKFEIDKDAVAAIGDKCKAMAETYNSIYCQTDNTKFLDKVDVNKIIDMLAWMSDGFIREHFQNSKPDLDAMSEEFEKYLNMLRRHFYKSPGDDMISIARSETVERDDTVMDQLRMDATFEARLEAGKLPQFEGEESLDNGAAQVVAPVAEIETESYEEPQKELQEEYHEELQEEYHEELQEKYHEELQNDNQERLHEELPDELSEEPYVTNDVVTYESSSEPVSVSLPNWWTQPESTITDSSINEDKAQDIDFSDALISENDIPESDLRGANVISEENIGVANIPVYEEYETESAEGKIKIVAETSPESVTEQISEPEPEPVDPFIDSIRQYGAPIIDVPSPVMTEIPVPAEILHTTITSDEDDDDEPWTPRPVRQIRL